MATVSQWTPFGVSLNVTATGGSVVRTSATQFTVKINASWEVYWDGAQTIYGMSATAGGVTKTISSYGTKRSNGSGSFTGTFSISGNGAATKTITVTFKNYNEDDGTSASKSVSFEVSVPAWSYTISYNANGGSGAPSNQTKYYNKDLTLSSTKPTRSGYTFVGWSTSSSATSATYSAGGSYKSNAAATLYAVWAVNTLTIKYHVNGGTLDSDTYYTSGGIVYGTSTSAAVTTVGRYNNALSSSGLYNASTFGLSRTGYQFQGWKVGSSGTTVFNQDDASIVPTDLTSNIKNGSCSIVMYAVWKLITFSVTYNANGGSGAPSSQTKNYGQTLVLSSTKPTRSGYTFVGWSTSSTTLAKYPAGGSYTANASVTLYAVWKKTITIFYDANGGSGAPSSQSQDIYNAVSSYRFILSTETPTRTGYTFWGWSTSSSATSATYSGGESITLSASITLYAVWSINSYKLTINPNGGKWNGITENVEYYQNYNTTKIIANPIWEGHTFSGWTLSGNGTLSDTTYTFGAGSGILTARWDTNTYDVKFDARTNGGWYGDPDDLQRIVTFSIEYGTTLGEDLLIEALGGFPTATRENYIFIGWFTAPTGGTQIDESYIVKGDVTFYAQFEIDASAYVKEESTWEDGVTYVTDSNGNTKKGHAKVKVNGVWKDGFCT